jgi:ADP-ribosylglycohydrolase
LNEFTSETWGNLEIVFSKFCHVGSQMNYRMIMRYTDWKWNSWAFHRRDSFQDAVLKPVNLVDEADTFGTVCGQLARAYWGDSGIPKKWLHGLAVRVMIEQAIMHLTQ